MCEPDPLELPELLSDEAIAQLIECLDTLARHLEHRYYAQLHRYYSQPQDMHQQSLWSEEPGEF